MKNNKSLKEIKFMMERLESPRMTDSEFQKKYKKLIKETIRKKNIKEAGPYYGDEDDDFDLQSIVNVVDKYYGKIETIKSLMLEFYDSMEEEDGELYIAGADLGEAYDFGMIEDDDYEKYNKIFIMFQDLSEEIGYALDFHNTEPDAMFNAYNRLSSGGDVPYGSSN